MKFKIDLSEWNSFKVIVRCDYSNLSLTKELMGFCHRHNLQPNSTSGDQCHIMWAGRVCMSPILWRGAWPARRAGYLSLFAPSALTVTSWQITFLGAFPPKSVKSKCQLKLFTFIWGRVGAIFLNLANNTYFWEGTTTDKLKEKNPLQPFPRVELTEYDTTHLTRKKCVVFEKKWFALPLPKTSLIDYVTRVLTRQYVFFGRTPVQRRHKSFEICSFILQCLNVSRTSIKTLGKRILWQSSL